MITEFFLVGKVRCHENKTSGENHFEDMDLVRVFINHLTPRPESGKKKKKRRRWVIEAVHEY